MNIVQRRKGFTLIELLVVIAIIGILATIIIVSLIGAQSKASDSKIQSNVKSIDTALSQYAVDNNGLYPSATTQASPSSLSSGTKLGQYINSGSSVFTFDTKLGAGYITDATAANFALEAGMNYKSYTTVTTGNGMYKVGSTSAVVVKNGAAATLTFDVSAATSNPTRVFAVTGPQ